MSLENKQVEPVELAQMSIYQSNTCRKDLNWLRFDNEPSVQDRQQEKDEKSCISVFCNISINLPYDHPWNTIVISGLVLLLLEIVR